MQTLRRGKGKVNDPRNILTHARSMMIETILLLTERSLKKRRELEVMKSEELSQPYNKLTQ
jgi:hypothetical protein